MELIWITAAKVLEGHKLPSSDSTLTSAALPNTFLPCNFSLLYHAPFLAPLAVPFVCELMILEEPTQSLSCLARILLLHVLGVLLGS